MGDNYLKYLSDLISQSSHEKADFHPINRKFLEPYIPELLKMHPNELLFYNLETKSPLYSIYFMLSLPEVWEEITVDDIIDMLNRFRNVFSFQTIIEFTYKYIEIDIIPLVLLSKNFKIDFKVEIIRFIKNMYGNFFKDDGDLFFFEKGLIGVSLEKWIYVKQLFLLDTRVRPAVESAEDFETSLPDIFFYPHPF